jgi:hypothetical protein
MIIAGFVLLAVGAVDLVRQFAPRRWIGYLTVAVLLLLLGSVSDALLPMIAALVVGALWVWSMPDERRAPLGFWPAVLLGVLSVGAVVSLGARADAGLIGDVWSLRSPFGDVSFDLAMLVLGAGVFLLESSNLVVRAALDGEHTWRPADPEPAVPVVPEPTTPVPLVPPVGDGADAPVDAAPTKPADPRGGFMGGRLIGPHDRDDPHPRRGLPRPGRDAGGEGHRPLPGDLPRRRDRCPRRVLPRRQPRQLGHRTERRFPRLVGGAQLRRRRGRALIAWSACQLPL